MKMDYTNEPDHLIVGKKELVTEELILQAGKTCGKRGYCWQRWLNYYRFNGSFGIVTEDAGSATLTGKTVVYTEGEFNIEKVNFASATKDKVIELCRNRNIYLRTIGGKE